MYNEEKSNSAQCTERSKSAIEEIMFSSGQALNTIGYHIEGLETILIKLRGSNPDKEVSKSNEASRPNCLMTELEKIQQCISSLESRLFHSVNELSNLI